jgi:hypothetical protein
MTYQNTTNRVFLIASDPESDGENSRRNSPLLQLTEVKFNITMRRIFTAHYRRNLIFNWMKETGTVDENAVSQVFQMLHKTIQNKPLKIFWVFAKCRCSDDTIFSN